MSNFKCWILHKGAILLKQGEYLNFGAFCNLLLLFESFSGVISTLKGCSTDILSKCNRELTAEQKTAAEKCNNVTNEFRYIFLKLYNWHLLDAYILNVAYSWTPYICGFHIMQHILRTEFLNLFVQGSKTAAQVKIHNIDVLFLYFYFYLLLFSLDLHKCEQFNNHPTEGWHWYILCEHHGRRKGSNSREERMWHR